MTTIKVLIDAGKASPAPPLGPALGPLGVNTMAIVNEINRLTKDLEGMQVPITIEVDSKKNFIVEVGAPLTSALIKKELKIKTAKGKVNTEVTGNLTFEQLRKIAKAKFPQLVSKDEKTAIKEILGTCRSMGVTVDGKPASVVTKEIDQGKYNSVFSS
ncbi:MAG TPA: 50S ribosomal protein L11 [archaeon]|jgi:large subunit ribosomal protein L11|nr:50S ribosomal protein L11 [archaeon]HPC09960.1 50S ribosomal protein L11 [archaeon]HRT02771.1 50S ribosomal protein L11 [Candidatus Diapherotrites archaeon]